MPSLSIFHPMIALAAWTFLVLLLIPLQRARALAGKRIAIDDFKLGESAQVPAEVSVVNRNYMNLLELPVLFYVACVVAIAAGRVDGLAVTLHGGLIAAVAPWAAGSPGRPRASSQPSAGRAPSMASRSRTICASTARSSPSRARRRTSSTMCS